VLRGHRPLTIHNVTKQGKLAAEYHLSARQIAVPLAGGLTNYLKRRTA